MIDEIDDEIGDSPREEPIGLCAVCDRPVFQGTVGYIGWSKVIGLKDFVACAECVWLAQTD